MANNKKVTGSSVIKRTNWDKKEKFQLIKDFYDKKVASENELEIHEIISSLNNELYNAEFKITEVGLFGVRGIEELTVKLEDDLTVIIGINGSGKSTILDSVSLILSWIKENIIRDNANGSHLKESDINNSDSVDYASISGSFSLNNERFDVLLSKSKAGKSLSRRSILTEIKALGGIFRHVNSNFQEMNLPLVAHYSVARSNEGTSDDFAKVKSQATLTGRWSKFDAYEDVLSNRHDFNEFIVWLSRIDSIARQGNSVNNDINRINTEIESTKNLINMFKKMGNNESFIIPLEEIVKKKNEEIAEIYNNNSGSSDILAAKVLKNIKYAIEIFLPEITNVELVYEQEEIKLILHKDGKEISAKQLSQGEKSLLSLIGDLTRRLVLLNPSRENPLDGNGIVLIDEIDLHLHPSWQQTVILNLQKTFPNLQLIVTTHSPQVLSTTYVRSIRSLKQTPDILNEIPELNIKNNVITSETPLFQTRGVMSTDILSKIMNIDPIPLVEEATWVHTYYKLIENEEENESFGLDLWAKIVEHFGPKHPVTIGCQNAIRLKNMKGKIKEFRNNKGKNTNKSDIPGE